MKLGEIWMIAFLIFLAIPMADALSLGVSPSDFMFVDMSKAGYATADGLISTAETQEVTINYEVIGEKAEWVSVDLGDGLVSKTKPLAFNVTVETPSDAANGDYDVKVRFFIETEFEGQDKESRIFTGLSSDIHFNIIGEENIDCLIGGVKVADVEDNYPLGLELTVKNNGNVRVTPRVSITVWDLNHEVIMFEDSFVGEEVLPTTEKRIFSEFDSDLLKGQYWIEIESDECHGSDIKTFSVLGAGEISDSGELLRLDVSDVSGGLVPVQGYFKNTGRRVVNARLRATVSLGGVIVDIIESDELEVKPNNVVTLDAFFNPEQQGDYVVKGQVIYNNKLSYEKAVNLKVTKEKLEAKENMQVITGDVVGAGGNGSWISVIVLFSIVGVLFVMVMIKRRKY
ncbi:MAG: hypothetical protein ABIE94_04585 [archaeon]